MDWEVSRAECSPCFSRFAQPVCHLPLISLSNARWKLDSTDAAAAAAAAAIDGSEAEGGEGSGVDGEGGSGAEGGGSGGGH